MNLKIAKPQTEAQKSTRTTLDTIEVTPDLIKSWKLPPFQRPLRVNAKLIALSLEIKADDGVIPGVITLGIIDKERYIVDGQHRREAFLMSECVVGYCDVRVLHFNDMAEMGDEFVRLNDSIVKMRPDDVLRGLEGSFPALQRIRTRCKFVGYDHIRRNDKAPVLSMSSALRQWRGSATEVPKNGGESAGSIAKSFTMEEAEELVGFLDCAFTAWTRDAANTRLWSGLNLSLCMWLYRRLVITQWSPRSPRLTRDMFTKCLMSISATETYVDWLVGRSLNARDLAPAYTRIKQIIAGRLEKETGKKPSLPQPSWATR